MLFENKDIIYEITPSAIPNDGILFVDHSSQKRGGHLGHAMVEYDKDKILCFYPNCSGDSLDGHGGWGWMEYKRSEDGGKTFGKAQEFPYSKMLYDTQTGVTAMCEKAVRAPNGDILVFNLICDVVDGIGWEPYGIPNYVRSNDGGYTWSMPERFANRRGRVFDAAVRDGKIYVLIAWGAWSGKFCNGHTNEYHLFVSNDNGVTFDDVSVLPFIGGVGEFGMFYGTMEWLPNNDLIVYIYRNNFDERNTEYCTSSNDGKSWSVIQKTYFAKKIRNMQMIKLENAYFMMGRTGTNGPDEEIGHNVIYCSSDGIHWDEGQFLKIRTEGIGAYSNTLLVNSLDHDIPNRVLYQASYAYDQNRTNIYHWWIDFKKK